MIEIIPYKNNFIDDWEKIVLSASSSNFLYLRKYLDYHGRRFKDKSLLIKKKNKVIGVFPAALIDHDIVSHPGITYGGLIVDKNLHGSETLILFKNIKKYYKQEGVKKIFYKALPYTSYNYPCQEDLYALNILGGTLYRRDLSSIIKMNNRPKFSKGKVWSINKSIKKGVEIKQSYDLRKFYKLLSETLEKHNTVPTHSLKELKILMNKFPQNIFLFEATFKKSILSGAIVYDYGCVVHTQYLASSDEGKISGSLDHLIGYLITTKFKDKKYFSFGISTERNGKTLNDGLISFKESFGARGLANDFYRINL